MELQKELFLACIQLVPNLEYIEQLLEQGANPLGRMDVSRKYAELVYPEILLHYLDENTDREALLHITELFLKYGMDIEQPEIPYDEIDITHPLWMLACCYGECGMEILQRLMDKGICVASARECWERALFDRCSMGGELADEEDYEMLLDAVRKIFLIASYPYIIEHDMRLQDEIWCRENDYDLTAFRQWKCYRYLIEPVQCRGGEHPRVYGATVTAVETENGRQVWKFKFGIPNSEAMVV